MLPFLNPREIHSPVAMEKTKQKAEGGENLVWQLDLSSRTKKPLASKEQRVGICNAGC